MFVKSNTRTPYFCVTKLEKTARMQLAEYNVYLHKNDIFSKITKSPYAPADIWRDWSSETFIGFSSELISFKSGHNFEQAERLFGVGNNKSLLSRLKNAAAILTRLHAEREMTPVKRERRFEQLCGSLNIPQNLTAAYNHHPLSFLHTWEVELIVQKNIPSSDRSGAYLEIGAGAGVNVLIQNMLWGCRCFIVDLPDTIPAAFIYIKSILPNSKIILPHEISNGMALDKHDFVFLTPLQIDIIPDGYCNNACNASSFGEMEINVVNKYIKYIDKKLKKHGIFISKNQEKSRHIKENQFSNYNLNNFEKIFLENSKYTASFPPYLKYICYIGKKL